MDNKNLSVTMRTILLGLLIVSISCLVFASPTAGTAIRTLPSTYTPQTLVDVNIDFVPLSGTTVWDIVDTFPSGWTPRDVNCFIPATRTYCGSTGDNNDFRATSTDVSWMIADGQAREIYLTYKVLPPNGTTGDKTFSGKIEEYVGATYNSGTVGGASTISLYTQAFDFNLSAANKSVVQGSTVTQAITINKISGTAANVDVTLSGLPTNATYSPTTRSCFPNTSCTPSDFTITAAATVVPGSYTITATGTSGTTTRTKTFTLTVNPAAPTGLAATVSSSQINLTWTAVSGATSYKIYRSTTTGNETVYKTGITTASYSDTNVAAGTTYYYKVLTTTSGVDSSLSTEVSATPPKITPTLTISISPSSSVTYGQKTDVNGRGCPAGLNCVLKRAGTIVTNPDSQTLAAGDYNYTYSTDGNAQYNSAMVWAKLTVTTALPATPTNLKAVAPTSAQVNVSWDSATGATTYSIHRSTTTGTETPYRTGLTSTSYSDTNVIPGVTYYYKVLSVNGGGSSALSTEANATVPKLSASLTISILPSSSVTYGQKTDVSGLGCPAGLNCVLKRAGSVVTNPDSQTLGVGDYNYTYSTDGNAQYNFASTTVILKVNAIVPGAPGSVAARAISSSQIDVNWAATTNAVSYKVYRGTVSGGETLLASGISTTKYSDTSVAAGTTYYYKVSAISNTNTESQLSNEVSATAPKLNPNLAITISPSNSVGQGQETTVTASGCPTDLTNCTLTRAGTSTANPDVQTLGIGDYNYVYSTIGNTKYNSAMVWAKLTVRQVAPAKPTGLTLTVISPTQINLSWTAVSGATSYKVYRGTASNAETLLASGITTNSYQNTGLVAGTKYYYKVSAVNSAGDSNLSDEASATTQKITPVLTISINPSNTVSQGISTSVSGNGCPAGLSCILKRDGVQKSNPDINTLPVGSYVYTYSTDGNEQYNSATTTATLTVNAIIPGAPGSVAARAISSSQIDVNWAATTNAVSYKVYRGTVSGGETLLASGISTTKYSDTNVTAGTTYYYKVSAISSTNTESPLSNEVSAIIQKITPSLSITIGPSNPLNVGSTSTVTGSGCPTGLTCILKRDGIQKSNPDTNILPVGTYVYTYSTQGNAQYNSATTTATLTVREVAPGTPTGVSAVSNSSSQITVSWTAVDRATSYKIYRGTASNAETLLASGITTNSYQNTGLVAGTKYYYKVSAVNTAGESNLSSEASATTQKIDATLSITIAPSNPINVGGTSTVTGSGCPAGLTCVLKRAGTTVSNPDTNTLPVGSYTYIYSLDGNAQYNSKTVTKTLTVAPLSNYSLVVTVSGAGTGSVYSTESNSSDHYIENCTKIEGDCAATFTPGKTVTLHAVELSLDSIFAGWTGACSQTTGTSCELTINDNTTVGAIFNLVPFDFSIAADVNTNLTQGSSTDKTITVTRVSGEAQNVNFSTEDLPTGVSASFNPASCLASCTTTMTLNAQSDAGKGSFNFTVSAATDTNVPIRTAIIALQILSAPSCGDGACNGSETCSSCKTDCGSCNTLGGGNTTGSSPSGGTPPSAPIHVLTSEITNTYISQLVEGKEATFYADTKGNYKKDDEVTLQVTITMGNSKIFSETAAVKLSADSNDLTIYVPAKWTPQAPGDYNATFTLLNKDQNKTYSQKSVKATVIGKQVGEAVTPGLAGQTGNAIIDSLQLEYSGRAASILVVSLILLAVLLAIAIIRLRKK